MNEQTSDQYPVQLLAQARTALLEWYTKELKKEDTEEELSEKARAKVARVMRVQFATEGEHLVGERSEPDAAAEDKAADVAIDAVGGF